jgi:hypothetical protein
VALIIGKNAYIRELNNGSSQAAAESAANSAIADYFSVKQKNLISDYERSVLHWEYMTSVAESESGIDQEPHDSGNAANRFVHARYHVENDRYYAYQDYNGDTETALLNGSSVSYNSYRILRVNRADGSTASSAQVAVDSGLVNPTGATDAGGVLMVENTSTASPYTYMDPRNYSDRWTTIQNQYDSATSQMSTVINNTYDDYQDGQINNSDLQDPYTLQQEYSPGAEYEGWAAAQLTLLGQNSPDTMENIGYMNVTDETDSSEYSGVLMSASNPSSGQFEVNQTYDAANLSGQQYIVTSSSVHELTGKFSLTAAQTHNGTEVQNVTIYEKQYATSNVSELEALYEDLAKTRAELEARQQNLLASGGGGALLGGSNSLALIGVAAVALYLLGREESG